MYILNRVNLHYFQTGSEQTGRDDGQYLINFAFELLDVGLLHLHTLLQLLDLRLQVDQLAFQP